MSASQKYGKKWPRGRFHRTFLQWLSVNEERLPYPVNLKRQTKNAQVFSFEGLTPKLELFIGSDIGIYVTHEEKLWDALIFFEGDPQKTSHGYVCALCKPEFKQPYASREALWIDHVFEPFVTWTQETLYPAKWLMLGQSTCGGVTWAELHAEKKTKESNSTIHWLPLKHR